MKIKVDISSSRPVFIEADANSFGETFAHMADDDQLAVLRAMVEHMRPHRIQWDFIALKLEKPENQDIRDQLREVLFTVISREDKYKAKSLIDTVIYRAGDQIGAWSYAGLAFLGLGMTAIATVAGPLSAAWMRNGLWLGRKQEALANGETAGAPAVAPER